MQKIALLFMMVVIPFSTPLWAGGSKSNGDKYAEASSDTWQSHKEHVWHYIKFHFPHQNMEVVEQSKEKLIANEQHDNATLEIHVVPQDSPQNIAKKLLDELKNQGEVHIEFEQKVPWKTIDAYEIHGTYEIEDGVHSFWVIGTHNETEGKILCCSIKMLVGLDDNKDDVWEQETQSCLTSCMWVQNEGDYKQEDSHDHEDEND